MEIRGYVAAYITEAARETTRAIRRVQAYDRPPLTLGEVDTLRELMNAQLKALREIVVLGVTAAAPLVDRGGRLVVDIAHYKSLADTYFSPSAETTPTVTPRVGDETEAIKAASQRLRGELLSYLQTVRRRFGEWLEGL